MLDATEVSPSVLLGGRRTDRSRLSRTWSVTVRFARRQPIGAACGLVILLLVLVAVFAGTLAPYSPTKNRVGPQLASPSRDYPFGTDHLGRDLLSRVIYGARISLYVGIAATLVSTLLGTLIGIVTGYLGGAVDYAVQRVVDAVQAVPPTIMLIAIMVALGPSITNVIIALSARGGLGLSRVVRGSVFGVRSQQYVESALAVGASKARVMLQHILPNILPTLLVLMSIGIGGNIIAEASLSFLGYGVPPPDPTWGGMISAEGRTYMLVNPWILIFPTLALSLVVYTFNMLGDALRDELDPRLRGSR
jgi:peptide/nickel transport system permease protein